MGRESGRIAAVAALLVLAGCAGFQEKGSGPAPGVAGAAASAAPAAGERAVEKAAPPAEEAAGEKGSAEDAGVAAAPAAEPGTGASKAPAAGATAGTGGDAVSPALREAATGGPQASPGLRAGFADDNRQFSYFLQFLSTYGPQVDHLPIDVQERIVLRVRDRQGRSLPGALVEVTAGGRLLCRGRTYADGGFLFFPAEHGPAESYRVTVGYGQSARELTLERAGRREVPVDFASDRGALQEVPLDILFVLDTTGSMGEEIQRLKKTIEIINLNLTSLSSRPRVRFGMVEYRDQGDAYVTKVVPFTGELPRFQQELARVQAEGGGDTPEDLQAALREALRMEWTHQGVRLAFVVTDAPPHLDYGQSYTYLDAVHQAREKGIKIFTVGTGGLDLMGEYILRQIAQYTAARYIFLTYGERGESEGGSPGSVSHHSGANYQTDKLEAIIIRVAREELSHLTDQPLEEEQDYFTAQGVGDERKEDTLFKLFRMAVSQLLDYSSVRLPAGTAAAVLPLGAAEPDESLQAEYFTEQLLLSFSRAEELKQAFRLVERQDLQRILEEMEVQLSGLSDGETAVRVGRLLGAEVLVGGRLYASAGGYELFLRLMRVETGEILSVTKAVIDAGLGL